MSRHDKWLCMMYPRLKLLQKLLADDGVIFISIDEIEHRYLELVMDEIFGSANRIDTFVWQTTMVVELRAIMSFTCMSMFCALQRISRQ